MNKGKPSIGLEQDVTERLGTTTQPQQQEGEREGKIEGEKERETRKRSKQRGINREREGGRERE